MTNVSQDRYGAPAVESLKIAAGVTPGHPHRFPKGFRAMKIGMIGAGQIGGTLTRRFTALGHEIFVANSRGPKTLSDLAA